MKQLFALLFFSLFIVACGGSEGAEVESGEALAEGATTENATTSRQYLVDPTASKVIWEGTKVVGGGHQGELPVEFGQMIVMNEDDRLVGGQFSLDLRKMTNTDLPKEDGDKLIGHLSAPDFFDVAKYPMIQFDMVQIEPMVGDGYTHEISGNLMMKGKKRSITIPANITLDGDKMTATTPQFTIDRNDWGVSYGNSITEKVKDNIISDEIGLQITLVANRG